MANKVKVVALLLGASLMAGLGATTVFANEGKCGAGKCGGEKKEKAAESKCGGEKKEKAAKSKCGGDKKAAESKCGGEEKGHGEKKGKCGM